MLLRLALDPCGNVEHITTIENFERFWSSIMSKLVKYVDADGKESSALVVEDHGSYVNLAVFSIGYEGTQAVVVTKALTSVLPWKEDERERSCYKD